MSAEILVKESRIAVPYTWSAGETGTRFLRALQDDKEILATKCPACTRVMTPPRAVCGRCFAECGEWLKVGPRGTLLSWTCAEYESPAHPQKNPYFGLIKLDGADTAILHLLGEVLDGGPRTGARVEPVFAEERRGHILDIRYFRESR